MKRVVLDPGHGGRDPGAVGNGLREKDLALTVAKYCRNHLVENYDDVRVIMTRETDRFVSIPDRAAIGDGKDLLVSIHFNSFRRDTSARGFETFCHDGPLFSTTLAMRKKIHEQIYAYLTHYGVPNRGPKRFNHDITRLPHCPVTLVEYLFLTNQEDARVASRSGTLKQLGVMTAEGIAMALALPSKRTVEPDEDSDGEPEYQLSSLEKIMLKNLPLFEKLVVELREIDD